MRQSVFYLGTAYESTRVKDERQDKILKEEVVPEVKETVFIDEELLSDQKRVIEVMEGVGFDRSKVEEEVGKHFKQVDKSGLGVLTHV